MSHEMLMQPLEQSIEFGHLHNDYYPHPNCMMENEANNMYYLGYNPTHMNENFRTAFYNPFEIKHRRRTSRAQLKVLEQSFEENPKPNATVRRILAQQLDMTPRGVQIWFQNRRAKAKLQRRKSGEDEELLNQEKDYQQHNNSPALYNQFINNLRNWDNTAKSIAAAAASSYMPHSFGSINEASKTEEWFKMPLHPLAPVIESQNDIHPSSSTSSSLSHIEEWRRNSCPALIPEDLQQRKYDSPSWSYMGNRRVTVDNINTNANRNEPNISNWNKTMNPIDMYSNLNCSPISQELTPILSAGSPVSSVDGNYYDTCLDLFITEPSPSL